MCVWVGVCGGVPSCGWWVGGPHNTPFPPQNTQTPSHHHHPPSSTPHPNTKHRAITHHPHPPSPPKKHAHPTPSHYLRHSRPRLVGPEAAPQNTKHPSPSPPFPSPNTKHPPTTLTHHPSPQHPTPNSHHLGHSRPFLVGPRPGGPSRLAPLPQAGGPRGVVQPRRRRRHLRHADVSGLLFFFNGWFIGLFIYLSERASCFLIFFIFYFLFY